MFRLFAFCFLLPALIVPGISAAQTISGRITSLNGQPLKSAKLELRSPAGGAGYATTSDAEGNFLFDGIAPGRYTLTAQRPGYVRASSTFELAAGQRLGDIVLKLSPEASLWGTVTDEDDLPIRGARVELYRWRYLSGTKTLVARASVASDARGSFEFANLEAGPYYLSAAEGRTITAGQPLDQPGRPGLEKANVRTYYPRTTDPAAAAPIELAAGAEAGAIRIQLLNQRVFRIRGKVSFSAFGQLPAPVILQLIPANSPVFTFSPNTALVDSSGAFEFAAASPGDYVIRAQPRATNSPLHSVSAWHEVAVTDRSLDDLRVELGPGATVAGRILATDSEPHPEPDLRVDLIAANGVAVNPPFARTAADGTFRMENVPADHYRIFITVLPPDSYVRSDAAHGILDLTTARQADVEMWISHHAARLAVTVHDRDGSPVPQTLVTLSGANINRIETTDRNGSFQFTNLPPGEYRAAAWTNVSRFELENPDFPVRYSITRIRLAEDARESLELTPTIADRLP